MFVKKKLHIFYILFAFAIITIAFPFYVQAQIGINVAAKHEDLERAAQTVGPGGWIVVMAKPGDADVLNGFISTHPDVNVVIRTHWPGTVPDSDWAVSWTATLGSLDTAGKKVFVMPWNEPNMAREAGGETDVNKVAEMVKNYTDTFLNHLEQAGLLGTKVEMLSPMINQSGPNFLEFVDAVGGASFFNQFYGISMNLYDFEHDCGSQPLCNSNPFLNAGDYRQVLEQLGIPDAKVFALETGIVDASGTCPPQVTDCPIFDQNEMFEFLSTVHEIWKNDPNFIMGSPLSYNPELSSHPDWIWFELMERFIRENSSSEIMYANWDEQMKAKFETWLNQKIAEGILKKCQDSEYGYGVSPEICEALGIYPVDPGDPMSVAGSLIDPGETMLEPVIFFGEEPDADYARTWTVNYLETANISDIGFTTAVHFENINLPLNSNYTKKEKSTGHVRFLYCKEGVAEYPHPVEGVVYFEVPAYYSQAALSTYQASDMMTYPDQRAVQTPDLAAIGVPNNVAQKDDSKKEDLEEVLASFPGQVLAQADQNCPDIGYSTWVEDGQLCWEIKGAIGGGLDACDWGYEVLIDGQPVAGSPIIGGANNCLVKEEEQTRINCYMGGAAPVPFSGSGRVSLNITQLQYSQGVDCRPSMHRENICEIQDDGTVVCTNSDGQVIEKPPAPLCYASSYTTGERLPVPNEPVATSGLAKIAAGILSRWEEFLGVVDGIEKRLRRISGIGDRYVIFPIITHPYTKASEIKYRQDFSAPFTLPGEGKDQKHAEVDVKFAEQSRDNAAVYGQKGWYDAYEYDTSMVSLPD